MKLLIDVGNTALKWTVTDATGAPGAVFAEIHRDVDDLPMRLASAWHALDPSGSALGCSVASHEVRAVVERAAAGCGFQLDWLGAETQHRGQVRLTNGYRQPMQLGADRWHGMLGACAAHPGESFVLIAAGTASTIDCVAVDKEGARFVGGCIAPGGYMMLEALEQRTAGLPHAHGRTVEFPDNTDDAIATGVADAQVGLARRVIERFTRYLGRVPSVLVSGGDAASVAAGLQGDGFEPAIEHNLVLTGLALRARMSSPVRS